MNAIAGSSRNTLGLPPTRVISNRNTKPTETMPFSNTRNQASVFVCSPTFSHPATRSRIINVFAVCRIAGLRNLWITEYVLWRILAEVNYSVPAQTS